jgi:2-keto-3-deoxy-L-rhamnonate aldolase RhmA
VRRVARAAAGAGKTAGLYAATGDEVAFARAEGLRLIAAGSDLTHMLAAARATIAGCAKTNLR